MPPRSKRAARALTHLPETDPALSALALWCRTADGPDPTRTRAGTILVGPEFELLPLREQIGLIGHHILHIALRHDTRMAAMRQRLGRHFDARHYNLAADALVNECLDLGGLALPRPAVTLTGLMCEVLHEPAEGALASWDTDRLYMALSALSGAGRKTLDAYVATTTFQPDLDPSGHPDTDTQAADWQGHLTRAAGTTGGTGRGIGRLLSTLADRPIARTPWEILLRRLLAQAVADHPRLSHKRPQRTWIAAEAEARATGAPTPAFAPGQSRDARRPRIVVGIDSSGSIPDTTLALFAAEVSGIARRSGAEIHALHFDDTVYRHDRLTTGTGDLHAAQVRRGGGTSFIDVMDKAVALSPSIIVILTDLDGPCGVPPPCRVIWATPQDNAPAPPFGTVLSLAR